MAYVTLRAVKISASRAHVTPLCCDGHVTSNESDAALVRRVRKLLDKAANTTNPHEADAFATKAAELVAAHRIDPSRLAPDEGDLTVRDVPLGRGAYVRGRLNLLMAIADANDVRVVFSSTPTGTVAHMAGFRSDVDVVEVMYASLHHQAATQMAAIKRATGAATQRYRRSFLFGFANRLGEVLADARRATEQAPSSARTGTTAIALRARSERVEAFAAEAFGRVRTARAPSAAQPGGWLAGAAAADRADVGRARLAGRAALSSGRRSA